MPAVSAAILLDTWPSRLPPYTSKYVQDMDALQTKLAAAADEGEQSRRTIEARYCIVWHVQTHTLGPANYLIRHLRITLDAVGL